MNSIRPSLFQSIALGALALQSLSAHAILKVITIAREEFYVYQSPNSGSLRELTFSSLPPGVAGPSPTTLAVEGMAFHENYLLAASVSYSKSSSEQNIVNAWKYFVTRKTQVQANSAAQQTQLDVEKKKAERLKNHLTDPNLTESQRSTLQYELNSANSNIRYYEQNMVALQTLRTQTESQEATYVKYYEDRLKLNRADLDRAFGPQYSVLIATASTDNLAYQLEQITTKGFCYRTDPAAPEVCEFGAPPLETNAWDKLSSFPNLTLKIDRQGQ